MKKIILLCLGILLIAVLFGKFDNVSDNRPILDLTIDPVSQQIVLVEYSINFTEAEIMRLESVNKTPYTIDKIENLKDLLAKKRQELEMWNHFYF